MTLSPETRLFRAYWQDGSVDLVVGGAVVLIGVGYLVELMLAPVFVLPPALAVWLIVRKRVVEPRAGYVELARRRRERSARELAGATAAGIGMLVLFLAVVSGAQGAAGAMRNAVDAVPALLIAVAALVAAGLTRAWRFVVYAAVMAGVAAVAVLVEAGPGAPLLVGGLVVWGTGAVLLARFVADSRRFESGP